MSAYLAERAELESDTGYRYNPLSRRSPDLPGSRSIYNLLKCFSMCDIINSINPNLTKEATIMKINKILCVLFVLAACCFLIGTVNHIVNTHEGWLSSLLLAGGCICGAIVFAKKN